MFCVELGAPSIKLHGREIEDCDSRAKNISASIKPSTVLVWQMFLSLIATADQAGVNSYEYLQTIQRDIIKAVKENPKWPTALGDYLVTLENMKIARSIHQKFHTANVA